MWSSAPTQRLSKLRLRNKVDEADPSRRVRDVHVCHNPACRVVYISHDTVGSGNIALLGFLRALAGPNKPYRPPEFAWSMAECIRLRKVNVLGGGAQHGNGDQ